MNTGKSNKKLIVSVVLVAVINIGAIFGWWLAFSDVQKEKNAVLKVRAEIETDEKRINDAKSLDALLKEAEKDKEKISATFLNSKNIVDFIKELELLGQKTGTNFSMKVIKIPEEKSTDMPHFEFQVSGSFRDIFQYLALLENLPYRLEFNRADLNQITEETKKIKQWQVYFQITLLSYYNENI